MNAVLLIIVTFLGYLLAYRTYGRFLGRKIFKLTDKNSVPAVEMEDGVDYVPTQKSILFGHHFTTIAGLGPIVGPAIGIIWGWVPALLWIFLGSIFMGAVHDFSTLIISARNKGQTIGELTGIYVGSGARYAFQLIMQLLLFIVLSVFALIVAVLLKNHPESVVPVWFQIPVAIWLSYQLQKGRHMVLYSLIALLFMYASIVLGVRLKVDLASWGFMQWIAGLGFELDDVVIVTWCVILFIYVYFASTLPVHRLLQPRDYINTHQLLLILGLLVLGIFIANPEMSAPTFHKEAFASGSDIPALMPSLFIIIACGAISGFHSIASSGTTVKQVRKESDTLFIGYGGMLMEGFLAVVVLVAIGAGLKEGAYREFYSSWSVAEGGIEEKLNSFVTGSSNLLGTLGVPLEYSKALIVVFIVSFANTTLDSATRMQRLSLQEIFRKRDGRVYPPFHNRYVATAVVVMAAAIMTFMKPGGSGALILWPLFGSLNQLLAALGLGIVAVYLHNKGKKYALAFIPMIFVLVMSVWAMLLNLKSFFDEEDHLLIVISLLILTLTLWLIAVSMKTLWKRNQGR